MHLNKIIITAILILLFSQSLVNGQQIINGKNLDMINKPIDSDSILTNSKNKTREKAYNTVMFSNKDGNFSIETKCPNDIIKFYKIGHCDTLIPLASVRDSLLNIHLKSNEAENLQTVTVKSKSPLVQRKLDRITIDVEHSSLNSMGSSFELIKYVPGVFIINGKINLNGKLISGILINDRRINLSGNELWAYLKSLNTNQIKSIEIISQPPSNYDAEGTGGLINIILKKHINSGFEGNLAMNYSEGIGKFPDYNPSFNFNYSKNKLGIFGGVGYEYYKTFYDIMTSREISSLNADYSATSKNVMNINLNSQHFGMLYDIHPNQYIGIDLMHNIINNRNITSSNVVTKWEKQSNNTFSIGDFSNISHTNLTDISGNYVLSLDTLGSNFRILSNITLNQADAYADNFGQTFNNIGNITNDTTFKYFYPNNAVLFTAQMDYKEVFNPNYNLSLGGKYSSTDILNKNHYEIYNGSSWLEDGSNKFEYRYNEKIFAGFINLKGVYFNVDYQLGVRGEYSKIRGQIQKSQNQNTVNKTHYFNLFPSFFLKKNMGDNKGNYFLFSYSRRIGRPAFSKLNPFKYFFDNYTTRKGNPNLTPQFTNDVELSYTIKNKYNIKLSYSKVNDMITQLMEVENNNLDMQMIYRNIGKFRDVNLTLSWECKIKCVRGGSPPGG